MDVKADPIELTPPPPTSQEFYLENFSVFSVFWPLVLGYVLAYILLRGCPILIILFCI